MVFPELKNLVNKDLLAKFLEQCKTLFADKKSVSAIDESLKRHIADSAEIKPYVYIKSCTEGSTKIFKLTIDDNGIITGEEKTD